MTTIACSGSGWKLPLEESLEAIAALGFHYVDLIAIPGWNHIVPANLADNFEAEASRVERALEASGLIPVAMNAAFPHPHQRNPADNPERLRQVDAVARLMKRLGIRTGSFYPGFKAEGREWEEVLADTAASIREMLPVAQRHDVTLTVELHAHTPFETIKQGRRLLETVPELRIAYDPSHFALRGIDLSDTEVFFSRTGHFHLRDAAPGKMHVACGEGTIDFERVVGALTRAGYHGDVSLEYLPGSVENQGADLCRLRDRLIEIYRAEGVETRT